MSSKDYIFFEERLKYGKSHFFKVKIHTIKCLGGEKMPEEKPQLVFVKATEIPTIVRRKSYNWIGLFDQIPKGQALVISEDDKEHKIASVKAGVKAVNKEAKKELFVAKQRTKDGKLYLYVTRA